MEQKQNDKRAVAEFKKLLGKQRELNDAQVKARRATLDMYLDNMTDVGQIQTLLKEMAINAAAW